MKNKHHYHLAEILVVEDEEDHSRLIKKTLEAIGQLRNDIVLIENGQEALDYLRKKGRYAGSDHSMPILILLDIKLPLKNGFEVLEELKADKELKNIPVVVLTTASSKEDIERALSMGANDYISKPVKFDDFRNKVNSLGYYWGIVSDSHKLFN